MDMMISISVKPDRRVEEAVIKVTSILPQRARKSPLDSRLKPVRMMLMRLLCARNTLDESRGEA